MKKFPHLHLPLANGLLLLLATLFSISLWSEEERDSERASPAGMRSLEPGSFGGALGLYFEENLGRQGDEVRFMARGSDYWVLLEASQTRISTRMDN